MPFAFGPDSVYTSSCDQFVFPDDRASPVAKPPTDISDYLYSDFDINGQCSPYLGLGRSCLTLPLLDFTPDVLSSSAFFEAEGQLTDSWESETAAPRSSSPVSRTTSRSSFTSSSQMGPLSPYLGDYPTPSSDSSVTTPTPSETGIGLPSDCSQASFSHDFSFGLESKKSEFEHALSYVPGSSPLSPSGFSFDFSFLSQPVVFPVSATSGNLADARRHSEPANVAAYRLAPFFAPPAPPQGAPPAIARVPPANAAVTQPITNQLVSLAPAPRPAQPSSIAPHQTRLLEIKSPRPVRAFKPPILLSSHHYDPKDFVRRRSEPILPLRELDVASHIPLDISVESEEQDLDSMDVEDPTFDGSVAGDDAEEAPVSECLADEADMAAWLGLAEEGSLFDPNWSWFQPDAHGAAAMPMPLPTDQASTLMPDWSLGVVPEQSVPSSLGCGPVWGSTFPSN